MIIETSDNRFYSVHETGNPDLAHIWVGTEVRFDKTKRRWVKRHGRRGSRPPQLVRKAACKIISLTGELDAS